MVWTIQNINVYLQYNTYISTTQYQEIPTNFPAVSICNLKFSNKTKSLSFLNSTLFPNGVPVFPRAFYGNDDVQDYVQYVSYYVQASVSSETNLTNKRYLGFEISDMFLSCTFNWEACFSDDFSYFYDPFYGNCFTYNSGTSANGSVKTPVQSDAQGGIYGLSLSLFLGDPYFQSQYELFGNGIVVLVHNQTNYPFFGNRRFTASAGMETDISIKRNFVSKLSSPYGNCLMDTSKTSSFASQSASFNYIVNTLGVTYEQGYCYLLCLQTQIIQKCNCQAGVLPYYGNTTTCLTFSQINCGADLVRYFNKNGATTSCVNSCPIPCNQIEYSVSSSASSYPNNYYKSLLMNNSKIIASGIAYSDLKDAVLKINVFYEALEYTVTQEIASLTIDVFIANIGGMFGLFIGITLLSLLELIDLAVLLFGVFTEERLSRRIASEKNAALVI